MALASPSPNLPSFGPIFVVCNVPNRDFPLSHTPVPSNSHCHLLLQASISQQIVGVHFNRGEEALSSLSVKLIPVWQLSATVNWSRVRFVMHVAQTMVNEVLLGKRS